MMLLKVFCMWIMPSSAPWSAARRSDTTRRKSTLNADPPLPSLPLLLEPSPLLLTEASPRSPEPELLPAGELAVEGGERFGPTATGAAASVAAVAADKYLHPCALRAAAATGQVGSVQEETNAHSNQTQARRCRHIPAAKGIHLTMLLSDDPIT
jgi:hypothetical protein